MFKYEIINQLIKKYKYTSYLEIGFFKGQNFAKIECQNKESVDVVQTPGVTYTMSSDDFFSISKKLYDIILVDGLHEKNQVYRDIVNSVNILHTGGTIVCHDICPPSERFLSLDFCGNAWAGWCNIRRDFGDKLSMFVVDTDYGCGIIRKGRANKYTTDIEESWDWFIKNRNDALNLMTVEEFKKWLVK
jgi:hypothetical protein